MITNSKVVEEKDWVYSAMIDYQELVKMQEFEGYSTRALSKIYCNMLECARRRFKLSSPRDVTVHQVTKNCRIKSTSLY